MLKQEKPEWTVPVWDFRWLMGPSDVTMILSAMNDMEQTRDKRYQI